MKFLTLTAILLLTGVVGFSQDSYTKLAFIQSRAENKAVFLKDGFKVEQYDYEDGTASDFFKKSLDANEYTFTYDSHGHLHSTTTITTDEDFYNEFKKSCMKSCKEVPNEDEYVDVVYENDGFRYEFSTDIGFLDMIYTIKVVKL